MLRRLSRSLPAMAAVVALAFAGAASLAIAGDGPRDHGDRWGHHHGWHGHHHERCGWKRVSGLDEFWLTSHIQTNRFEIAGGTLAQQRAVTDEVRALGAELVRDHTAALEQAEAVASKVGVAIPDRPSPLQDWAGRAVAQFGGIEFDRWFADLNVAGHMQAITETSFEVKRGCNRKVRGLAAAALPVLQRHLEHAQAVLRSLSD
jgi:predicted outer membrane protein